MPSSASASTRALCLKGRSPRSTSRRDWPDWYALVPAFVATYGSAELQELEIGAEFLGAIEEQNDVSLTDGNDHGLLPRLDHLKFPTPEPAWLARRRVRPRRPERAAPEPRSDRGGSRCRSSTAEIISASSVLVGRTDQDAYGFLGGCEARLPIRLLTMTRNR